MEIKNEEERIEEEWETAQQVRAFKEYGIMFLIATAILSTFLFICLYPQKAHAYTQEEAIKAVIGEAEGEPQEGKEAIACAIHYRGNLKGVFGLHAPRVIHQKYSKRTYQDAKEAVYASEDKEYCDGLIAGASFWEGYRFPKPYWANSMTITAHIGHQVFYRKD